MQDLCSICASHMYASVDYPCVGKFDCVPKQVNVAQEFPPFHNSYSNAYNHSFMEVSKC